MGCVVLKDRFGDCHAQSLRDGEANQAAIKAQAADFAQSLGFEPGETYQIGLCSARDPGAARLRDGQAYADGGIEWLYQAAIQGYAYGNGEPGCLHDGQGGPFASKAEACDGAAEALELSDQEKADLLAHGIVYFSGDRRHEVGAGMVEIFECDPGFEPCP